VDVGPLGARPGRSRHRQEGGRDTEGKGRQARRQSELATMATGQRCVRETSAAGIRWMRVHRRVRRAGKPADEWRRKEVTSVSLHDVRLAVARGSI
jgi:hypothetical protein